MSMYITDSGSAYSSSFYTVSNHRVYNPETNRSLGVLVRTIPSNNYLCLKNKKERSLLQRIYNRIALGWTRIVQDENEEYSYYVRSIGEGKLAEDMRKLRKAGN